MLLGGTPAISPRHGQEPSPAPPPPVAGRRGREAGLVGEGGAG